MRASVRVFWVGVVVAFIVVSNLIAAEPVRLYPGVARANGANQTVWRTEGVLFNPGPAPRTVLLELLPRGGNAVAATLQLELQAGESRRLDDVYTALGAADGAGMLRVTGDVATWLRTFNRGSSGTFGQDLPELDPAAGIAAGSAVVFPFSTPVDVRQQFRSNLLLVNLGTEPATFTLRAGAISKTTTVIAGASAQVDNLGAFLGTPPGFATVTVSADGPWHGIVSTVDPGTGDPTTVRGLSPATDGTRLFAGVAKAAGANQTTWRSEAVLSNPGETSRSVQLELIPRGQSQVAASTTLTLAASETRRLTDIYDTLGVAAGAATLRVTGPVLVWVRTFNQGTRGSFGQDLPELTSALSVAPGHTVALPFSTPADSQRDPRSNLVLTNLDRADITVAMRAGDRLVTRAVRAGASIQVDNLGAVLNAPVGTGTVWVSADGNWSGVVSTIDAVTGDPTTVRGATRWRPPSSADLIEAARASGQLSDEQALVDRVLAEHDDPRLAAGLRGDDRFELESDSLWEAADRWDTLSTAAQDTIGPFFAPPFVSGSWWDLAHQKRATASLADGPPCRPWERGCPISADWDSVTGTNVRIWFLHDNAAIDWPIATDLAAYADTTIWPGITAVLSHTPLPDGDLGGGPQLDIALVDGLESGVEGRTRPANWQECKATPAYILLNRGIAGRDKRRSILAHEMFHAAQFSYNSQGCLDDYRWLMEATATWFEDYLNRTLDREHGFARAYLDAPEKSLDDSREARRMYGAYLYFFYLTRVRGTSPQVVDRVWTATVTDDALHAFDNGVRAGGADLKDSWPDFLAYCWNEAAPFAAFRSDRLTEKASIGGTSAVTEPVGDDTYQLGSLTLPHLSARYYQFDFPDATASSVAFYNGLAFALRLTNVPEFGTTIKATALSAANRKGISVQLLAKINGVWRREIVTGAPYKLFCRDTAAERLESLVVIVANSDIDPNRVVEPRGQFPPVLAASNYGCHAWQGSANLTYRWGDAVVERMEIVDLRWQAISDLVDPDNGPVGRAFTTAAGSYQWTMTGSDGDCSVSAAANGTIAHPYDTFIPLVWLVGGGGHRRFASGLNYVLASRVITVHWSCPNGGYDEPHSLGEFVMAAVPVDDAWAQVSPNGKEFTINAARMRRPGLTGSWHLVSAPE